MKTETPKEIAESISTRGLPFSAFRNEAEWRQTKDWMTKEVEAALNAERERCAKIAETPYGDKVRAMAGDEPQAVGKKTAGAIRGTNADSK